MGHFYRMTLGAILLAAARIANAQGIELPSESSKTLGQERPVTIEVATLGFAEAGAYLLEEIESFNKTHPEIAVTYYAITLPRREDTPLNEMTHIGRNVIGLASIAGTEPYYLVSRDLLVPIDKFLPDANFPEDLFYENLWDAVTYKGQRWGVPFLCNSYGLFCDWSRFEAVGIAEPPKTWEDYFSCAKRLSGLSSENSGLEFIGGNIGFASRFERPLVFLWKTMVLQKGGYFVKNGRFDLTHPSLREAFDFIRTLQDSEVVVNDEREFSDALRDSAKQYAMWIQPINRIKNMESFEIKTYKGGPKYRIAPLPTFGKEVSLGEKRYYLAIRKSAPEKEAASWEFIKWLCRPDSPPKRRGPGSFTFPSMRTLLERSEVLNQFSAVPENSTFVHTGKSWPVQWHNMEADTPAATSRFNEILEDLFADKISFENAMGKSEIECNAILRAGQGEVHPYALYRQ